MKATTFDLGFSLEDYEEQENIRNFIFNKSWRLLSDSDEEETYIFKRDTTFSKTGNIVMIKSGIVSNATFTYIPENKSLIVEEDNKRVSVKPMFLGEDILILKVADQEGYAFLIDEECKSEITTTDDKLLLLQSLLEEELKAKAKKQKSKFSTNPIIIILLLIILFFFNMCTGIQIISSCTRDLPTEQMQFKIGMSWILALLGITILLMVWLNDSFKKSAHEKISKWKEEYPNSPLNKYL